MKVINKNTKQISLAYFKRIGTKEIMLVDGQIYNRKKFDKTFNHVDPTEHYVKINTGWINIELL